MSMRAYRRTGHLQRTLKTKEVRLTLLTHLRNGARAGETRAPPQGMERLFPRESISADLVAGGIAKIGRISVGANECAAQAPLHRCRLPTAPRCGRHPPRPRSQRKNQVSRGCWTAPHHCSDGERGEPAYPCHIKRRFRQMVRDSGHPKPQAPRHKPARNVEIARAQTGMREYAVT